MNIRPETSADFPAIWRVNFEAFDRPAEADLVNVLRAEGVATISLVAEQDGEIVGHILFSPVQVDDVENHWTAIGLGPMAVAPSFQRRGIGSALVREGLSACRAAGHEVVFVLGHPPFYPKFGFRPTEPEGIRWEKEVPAEVFMVCEAQPGSLRGRRGVVRYHPSFDGVD